MSDEEEIVVTVDDEKDLAAQYKELEAENNQRAEREAAANRRAEEAHRAAQEAIREAEAAKAQARSSNADTINTALASATAEVEAAKQEQSKRREASQERVSADPVESYIAGRSAPTAQWLRSHTDYIIDPRKNAKMNAAHHDAVAEGFAPDTSQYFEHVEKFLGLKQPDNQQLRKRPASRPVAPTATANGSSSSNASNEVRLTAGEARSATDGTIVWNYDDPSGQKRFRKGDPIGVQEMARRKKAMKS